MLSSQRASIIPLMESGTVTKDLQDVKDEETSEASPGSGPIEALKASKFACTVEQLRDLIDSRNVTSLYALGGLAGLEKALRTNRHSGLSADESGLDASPFAGSDNVGVQAPAPKRLLTATITTSQVGDAKSRLFADRKHFFGDNHLPAKREPNFLQLMWMAYNDYVLFLLTGAAVVSLALGLYQSFGTPHTPNNPRVEWVEGVAILTAIVIIVLVGALNDYQKQRQFRKLNQKKQDRDVQVIRSGRQQEIPIYDVVVGDVVQIEPGDIIPADGILLRGYHIRCDESTTTGESNLRLKHSGDEVFHAISQHRETRDLDPFIISGTKVAEGIGTFLVIATGINSSYGKILLALDEDPELTPLQVKLTKLAKQIAIGGAIAALILFIVLFIKFLASLPHSTQNAAEKGQLFLNIFIIALTVVVIAVPEGLPLAVTLALAFATTRMLRDNNLVRALRACETMGNATTICCDKTGTLTQNRMTVVAGTFGMNSQFVSESSISQVIEDTMVVENTGPLSTAEYMQGLSPDVKSILKQSIVLNTTAFEADGTAAPAFIGSRTESALLTMARDFLGMGPVELERSNTEIVHLIPFDASRQCMITVVRLENNKYRAYIKGASEVLLRKCLSMIENPVHGLSSIPMTDDAIQHLEHVIGHYAIRSLRTISLVYRDFETWPPEAAEERSDSDVPFEEILQGLTFLGVVGIRDPLRDGARDAVLTCQKAGVVVRMVTGDNILTAKAVAEETDILSGSNDVVMEGREFRLLDQAEQIEVIPRLKVLARSTPEDKRALVIRLKEMGELVAVTGDGTNDAPALTAADIGFSMGISGTEVAREASSIVLMDDNFASIVKAIMWGRAVNDAIKKFLQFQITITVTSVGLTFVSAVANSNEQSVLTAVQLMWVNLFQDTLAALALATDPPSKRILDRKPERRSAPLITVPMWKMIVGQSIYQMVVTLILYFAGSSIFSYDTAYEKQQLQSAVFNTYVWLQIFNMFNNRQLENSFNILAGLRHNWLFIAVSLVMIGGQILIAFVGGQAFSVVPLSGVQWAYSIVLGLLSIPVGYLIRQVPDAPIERLIGGGQRYMSMLNWRGHRS